MLFINDKDLFDYLAELADKYPHEPIYISSYGMYLGISKGKDWHPIYPSEARTFIDKVQNRAEPPKILIGIRPYLECHKDCTDCRELYDKYIHRLNETVDTLELNTRFTDKHHLKMYVVGNIVILGGINLSGSGYTDAAVVVDSEAAQELIQLFVEEWENGLNTAQEAS